jgi:hypothetical protein
VASRIDGGRVAASKTLVIQAIPGIPSTGDVTGQAYGTCGAAVHRRRSVRYEEI